MMVIMLFDCDISQYQTSPMILCGMRIIQIELDPGNHKGNEITPDYLSDIP